MNLIEPQTVPQRKSNKYLAVVITLVVISLLGLVTYGIYLKGTLGKSSNESTSKINDGYIGNARVAKTMVEARQTLYALNGKGVNVEDDKNFRQVITITDVEKMDVLLYNNYLIRYGLLDTHTTALYKDYLLKIYENNIYIVNKSTWEVNKYPLPDTKSGRCELDTYFRYPWIISADPLGQVHIGFRCSMYTPGNTGYRDDIILIWALDPSNGVFKSLGDIEDLNMDEVTFAYQVDNYFRKDSRIKYALQQGIYPEQIVHTFNDALYTVYQGPYSLIFNYSISGEVPIIETSKIETFAFDTSYIDYIYDGRFPPSNEGNPSAEYYLYGTYTDSEGYTHKINLVSERELSALANKYENQESNSLISATISRINDTTLKLINPRPEAASTVYQDYLVAPEYSLDLVTGEFRRLNPQDSIIDH